MIPDFNHGEIIASDFRRTRVTVGLMTAAKLLSAMEPVIRYQRGRLPRSPERQARLNPIRTRHSAKRRRVAPPGRCMGHGEAAAHWDFRRRSPLRQADPMNRKLPVKSGAAFKVNAEMKALREMPKPRHQVITIQSVDGDRDTTADPLLDFVWRMRVGRCDLLLQLSIPAGNAPEDLETTSRLHGGDAHAHPGAAAGRGRFRALRPWALRRLHLNEGHGMRSLRGDPGCAWKRRALSVHSHAGRFLAK